MDLNDINVVHASFLTLTNRGERGHKAPATCHYEDHIINTMANASIIGELTHFKQHSYCHDVLPR